MGWPRSGWPLSTTLCYKFVTGLSHHTELLSIGRTSRQPNYPNQLAPKRWSQRRMSLDPNLTWWAYQAISLLSWPGTLSTGGLISPLFSTGSTLYSEGSFVRRLFSPKPFEVAMVRRTYGLKVLYSEVPLLRKLLCSEDSMFRKALHYMDSMLRRFFSPKFI